MAVTQKPAGAVNTESKPKVGGNKGVEQDAEQQNTVQDEAATDRKRHPGPWVKLHKDPKEAVKLVIRHSKAGNLIGHDNKTQEVILKDPDFVLPEESAEPMDGGIKE